jgi:hypothetical protein
MVIARRTPFRTVSLGRHVAALLVENFAALRRAPNGVETSLTLRRRCADALAFLEVVGLVAISQDGQRTVKLTRSGKEHLDQSGRASTDLGLLVRQLKTAQERIKARIGEYER